jgi:nicotinamidase-related amidase
MLAVLKAGGAFLPLDPGDPRARLAAILNDADPRAIVVTTRARERFQALGICLIDVQGEPADEHNPQVPVDMHDAACVYYTSGSTGEAKGVVLEHGGLVNHLRWVDRMLLREHAIGLPLVNRPTFAASLNRREGRMGYLVPGGFGSDFFRVAPLAQELVIVKAGYDPFLSPEFEAHLRDAGIESLTLVGAFADVCVDATARTAYQKGFAVRVLDDCTMGLERDTADALAFMRRFYGAEITSSDAQYERTFGMGSRADGDDA